MKLRIEEIGSMVTYKKVEEFEKCIKFNAERLEALNSHLTSVIKKENEIN